MSFIFLFIFAEKNQKCLFEGRSDRPIASPLNPPLIDTTVLKHQIADSFTGHTVPQASSASSFLHTRNKTECFFTFGLGSSSQSTAFSIEQLEMSFVSPYYSFPIVREPSDRIISKLEANFSLCCISNGFPFVSVVTISSIEESLTNSTG